MNSFRWIAAIGLTVLCIALVLVIRPDILSSFRTPVATPAAQRGAAPDQGTAHYAFGMGSTAFSVQVDKTERANSVPGLASSPSTQYVLIHLRFQNESSKQQRADPNDFRLRDSQGRLSAPVSTSGPPCQAWPKTDLVPASDHSGHLRDADAASAGPSFGPVTLCFQTSGTAADALTLIWDPDVSIGLLSSPTEIPLGRAKGTGPAAD